jgi:hypothetical protein
MIDSGATGNFLSHKFTSSNDLAIQKKKAPYELIVIDGSPLSTKDGRVDRETMPLPVAIQKHHKKLTFDIIQMATHNVILGMPWLELHNPTID